MLKLQERLTKFYSDLEIKLTKFSFAYHLHCGKIALDTDPT